MQYHRTFCFFKQAGGLPITILRSNPCYAYWKQIWLGKITEKWNGTVHESKIISFTIICMDFISAETFKTPHLLDRSIRYFGRKSLGPNFTCSNFKLWICNKSSDWAWIMTEVAFRDGNGDKSHPPPRPQLNSIGYDLTISESAPPVQWLLKA